MLSGERLSFQVAFSSDSNEEVAVTADDKYSQYFNIYTVNDVPVKYAAADNTDNYFISKEPGDYPDLLIPGYKIEAEAGKWYSFWFEFSPVNLMGEHTINVSINEISVTVKINILPVSLPEQKLIYTNWFHCDGICDYYNVDFFSEEFLDIFGKFVKTAANHGMNCILTPLFTPALDTQVGGERTTAQLIDVKVKDGEYTFDFSKLKKFVDICRNAGIEYFEMSHFFTQWGAEHSPKVMARDESGNSIRFFGWETPTYSDEYNRFLTELSIGLKEFIEENNLSQNVFFHISDEPSKEHLDVYLYRAALVKRLFPDYPVIDALSDYEFYKKGAVDIPIPCENNIEDFYGRVEHFWTYYCCGQSNEYVPNRFITMPSSRNRVFGILAAKYDVEGFLQWGFNFYNSSLSVKHINPFEDTDAGGFLPAGDPFVVYPGENGEPLCSLRLKVFNEALQDYRALKLLESLTGKDEINGLIGDITFKNYPHNADWLLDLRELINSKIQSNFKIA